MAHRDLFGIVLENRRNFPLNFIECPGVNNIRRVQRGRGFLIEDKDACLLESYRKNVGVVHQCQMPWIVGLGVNGGRPHIIPDGRTLWQFIDDEVGPLMKDNYQEWVSASLEAVSGLLPEYIQGSHTMKVMAEQGDLLNLCGGVMVARVGYNPVHALLLMLTGMGFTGCTYNSLGIDTADFADRARDMYLPGDFAQQTNTERSEIDVSELPTKYNLYDIGEKSIENFKGILSNAKTVFLSGPCGVFENPAFMKGTKEIFTYVANSEVFSIVGGGHTVAAVEQLGLNNKISHISTGGGSLEKFMMGEKLPVVEALKNAKKR